MSRSMIRNLLLGSAVALASAQIDSLSNMDLTTAEAVPTTCSAAQMSSIYNSCMKQCEPTPANAIIGCDDVQTRFQIVKCAAMTEQCNGQPESGVVRQAQANRLKDVCTNADSFRLSDVTLVFASAAEVANSLSAQSQIDQLTMNAQALNNNVNSAGRPVAPATGYDSSGMPGSGMPDLSGSGLPPRFKRGIKPTGRNPNGGRGAGGLYGSDTGSNGDVLGPLPSDIDMMMPPMFGPSNGRPRKGLFPNNNGTGYPGTNGLTPIDIIGVNGPGGITIDIIDDTQGYEIGTSNIRGIGGQKQIGGRIPRSPDSPRSPKKVAGYGSGNKTFDFTSGMGGANSSMVGNQSGYDEVNSFGTGKRRKTTGSGLEIGVGSGSDVDTYEINVNGKGWSKGGGSVSKTFTGDNDETTGYSGKDVVNGKGKTTGSDTEETGYSGTGKGFGSGSGQGSGSGSGSGQGSGSGNGSGQGNGSGYGQGNGSGQGSGSGSGSGYGQGNGSGNGIGSGSGQGVGSGSGQGVGTGSGQGVGTGSVQGVGTGSGQGVGTGSGQGNGYGSGQGIGSGVGQGVGSGSGKGVGSGLGEGVGSGVGQGIGSGYGSGVGQGVGSGSGKGVGSGVGSGEGYGSGVGSGSGSGKGSDSETGSGSGHGSGRKSSGSGDGKGSGSGKGAGVKEYTWKQTGGKKGDSSSSSSSSVGSPFTNTLGNGTGAKGYNTTKFHTTNTTASKPNSVAKLAAPALSAVLVCALTAFFSF